MRILLLLAVSLSSCSSFAYQIEKSMGFGLGYTWTESVFNDPIRTLNGETETPIYSDVTNSSKPFNFYINFRFHKYYGAELGYINYGKINFNKSLIKTKDNDGSLIESRIREASISLNGVYLSHVLYIPITDTLMLQGKAGMIFGSSEYSDIETLTIVPQDGSVQQPDSSSPNSTYESLSKPQLAAALLYKSTDNSNWRLQLSQLEVSHDGEKETFNQWFTQLSYEIKL